jgi:phage terminase small subunit
MTEELKLSRKHRLFVDEYLRCFNATRAYLRVYPSSSERAARANAARLIATDNIKAAVEQRLAEVHMSADEALALLAEHARGDIGEIMEATTFGYNLDMRKAKETGFTKLIKKVKQKTVTIMGKGEDSEDTEIHTIEIETYDAQAAIDKVLRVAGRYKDVGTPENPAKVIFEIVRKDLPNPPTNPPPQASGIPDQSSETESDRGGTAGRENDGS